ncbi:MAG: carboxypeptidase regulatory-like domain-containing protein [Gemmatimonadaceae bacterium]
MRASIIGIVFAASTAIAQTPAIVKKPFGVIEGVAVDSLRRDFLRGAVLTIEGTFIGAVTDSLGRFRIDSVPPGAQRVEVSHPLLETMGIGLLTPPLKLDPGQQLELVVGVPSAKTIVSLRCDESERRAGPAALLGTVQRAESESPAAGSEVILEWIEISVSGKTIRSIPIRRTATVGPSGRFKICGLPDDLAGSLIAVNGQDSTSSIGVSFSSLVGIAELELPESAASGSSALSAASATNVRTGNAVLTGRILDPNGAGIPRARVTINGDSAVALSDAEGHFVLRNLRSGTRSLSVRRLGFEPTEIPVSVHTRSPVDVTVKLEQFVIVLDTVRITAFREMALDRVGFSRRKKTGMGYYLTPEQIARSHAFDLPALLRTAPMLRQDFRDGHVVVRGRPFGISGGCVTWWLDDVPWIGEGVEEFVRPDELAAVEVYSSNFTPAQYRRFSSDCETIVLWTKQKVH